jgi:DNA-binding PadR family transcriptional regulator
MNDLIILSTLLAGPKHGYQLKREAGLIFGDGEVHNNVVYPLLRRFRADKWVSCKSAPGQRGQMKVLYALTQAGRKYLIAALGSYSEQDARSPAGFRIRVAMFSLLRPAVRTRILDLRESFLRSRLANIAAVTDHFPLERHAADVVSQVSRETKLQLQWIGRLRRLK